MAKPPSFQCYLIVGDKEQTREVTKKLAASFGIDIDKTSPDIFIISPQNGTSTHISIDQIRTLKKSIFQKPFVGKFKFILITQADALTTQAQNSLLKILEEPPAHAIIVLEAKNKAAILPTIRSRVITQVVKKETKENLKSILLKEPDTIKLLENVTSVEDPILWLDDQIIGLYKLLGTNTQSAKQISPAQIGDTIEKCINTKKMIAANVNPTFALINLIFSLKLNA